MIAIASSVRLMPSTASMRGSPARAHIFCDASESAIRKLIDSDKVVVFCKTTCPFCVMTAELFDSLDQPFTKINLNDLPDGVDVQDKLAEMTGQRTVPNVFINGKHLGGNDDTQKAAKSGKLQELLAA